MKINTKKPLISVIMPVYNAADYVEMAIKSILDQTETNFEFLIIDDSSQDESWKIISSYAKKDSRIKAFRNKDNIGLVKSLNKLLPKTKGQYIARMDADDISLSNRFEKQIKFLQKNPELVACGGQVTIIDSQNKILSKKYFPTNADICYEKIMNYMVIQPPVLMAKGDVMRNLRYDNHIFKNDDISMHFKLLSKGPINNVKEMIFKYRYLPNSITHKNPKKVYFLALRVRMNAIIMGLYTPKLVNVLLAFAESIIVSLLPNKLILFLFDIWRCKKPNFLKQVIRQTNSIFAMPQFLFAKLK